ncbi:hypothetical protein [Saccharibacillus sacchari]|uniref:hypothetical protein n=1 Tax=Saccharibacillus sacchari TaxID=456493 RepID=UPI00055B348D|nr:hypothetical protein [Saccharibacillus sacchari]
MPQQRNRAATGVTENDSAARRLGGSAARRLGGSAARRLGGSAARRLGGSAARRLGGSANGSYVLYKPKSTLSAILTDRIAVRRRFHLVFDQKQSKFCSKRHLDPLKIQNRSKTLLSIVSFR